MQDIRDRSLILGREDALEEGRAAHPSVLAGESHGQRSLAGYSPSDCKSQTRLSAQTTTTTQTANFVIFSSDQHPAQKGY